MLPSVCSGTCPRLEAGEGTGVLCVALPLKDEEAFCHQQGEADDARVRLPGGDERRDACDREDHARGE